MTLDFPYKWTPTGSLFGVDEVNLVFRNTRHVSPSLPFRLLPYVSYSGFIASIINPNNPEYARTPRAHHMVAFRHHDTQARTGT
jgi:hypothetical protein